MFDPLQIALSISHALGLIALLVLACRRLALPWQDWPVMVGLMLWGSLVLGGHGASALNSLGSLGAYVPATFLGAGLLWLLVKSVWAFPADKPLLAKTTLPFVPFDKPKDSPFIFWFLVITLGLFAAVSLVLGMSVYPDNADSMIYRLPRAVWYVSNGSFLHPFTSPDNRLLFYPLNGVSLYVPLVLYGLPGTFHSIPSLISWSFIIYMVYRFGREMGAGRIIALFSAWLVALTPSILAQAISTNDEIIAAAALLACLLMGWRWLVTGRHLYFFMSGFALSLSAGTKLHIVFLLPLFLVAALIAVLAARKNPALIKRWGQAVGGKTALLTGVAMFVIFTPFLFYNYASVGRFYFLNDFKDQVFNLSASLQVGFQNLLMYLSQMIFSPIADMNFWPVANDRQAFNTALNSIFNPLIMPLIDTNPAYYHLNYRYAGVTLPVSVRFVEYSLWSAFIWMLWPFQAILALKLRNALRPILVLLALVPPLWLLFWSFSTLYMEGTATYFTFYLVCASPAVVLTFLQIKRAFLNELRWVVVVFVAFSSLLICHNLVMFSGFRAIPDLFYSRTWPYDWLLTEKTIIDEIRAADRIRIMTTHEKMPYFGYMHWNPTAKFYTPFPIEDPTKIPDFENILQIIPVSGLNMYGYMPLRIPDKATPGITYLGAVRAIGREAIFARGRGVEKRYPDQKGYLVPQAVIEEAGKGLWTLSISEVPLGFAPEDRLTFEYLFVSGERTLFHRPPNKSPGLKLTLDFNPHQYQINVTIIVRSEWSGKELTRATYLAGGPGMWLPDVGEY